MSESVNRVCWVDTLKGLLIVLVVFGHAITNYSSIAESAQWNRICDAIYVFHMPAFFFVSGYLQSRSISNKTPDRKYCIKKIVSLAVPMIAFSVLYWTVKYVATQFTEGVVANPQSIFDLLLMFIYPIGEYWFLYALLLISLVDICFSKFKVPVVVQGIFWLVLLAATNWLPGLLPFFGKSVFPRMFRNGIYFLLGKVFFLKLEQHIKKSSAIIVLAVMLLSWIGWYTLGVFDRYTAFRLILTCSTIIGLVIICNKFDSVILRYLGKNSMEIYLLHPYFIVLSKITILKVVPNIGVYFIVSTILSIALSCGTMVLISKVKFLDFFVKPLKYINNTRKD